MQKKRGGSRQHKAINSGTSNPNPPQRKRRGEESKGAKRDGNTRRKRIANETKKQRKHVATGFTRSQVGKEQHGNGQRAIRGQGGPGEKRGQGGPEKKSTAKNSAHGNSATKRTKRNNMATNHRKRKLRKIGKTLMEKKRRNDGEHLGTAHMETAHQRDKEK